MATATKKGKQPNILVIWGDDIGWQNVSAYGMGTMGYTTPNPRAAALLTPEERRDLITTPETLAKIVQMDPAWVIENRARTLDRWNRWISS